MKRTFIIGYYGSGKSEVSINLAINEKYEYLVDLDVVNPYFRSRQVDSELSKHRIKLLSSTNVDTKYLDMPYIDEAIYELYEKFNGSMLFDFGGDAIGASIIKQFDHKNNLQILFVINVFRPYTNSVANIIKQINKIEIKAKCKITGLINNSNMLEHTTVKDVLYGQKIIEQVSKKINVPLVLTTYIPLINKDLKIKNNTMELKRYLKTHDVSNHK
ncbi:MAG: hypothetical protein Ta2E_03910 [Mycoplasmoidaceae bacterium]|nr:MAG: hypothetical protein Ta2E_03910 [Mycoplasmoidaceae bacterium]